MFPAHFEGLEQYGDWALPQESERNKRRMDSSFEEMSEMYQSVLSRIDEIVEVLDAKPGGEWDESDARLLSLSLSFIEVGVALERYRDPMVFTSFDLGRVIAQETSYFRPQVPHLGYVPPPLDYREPIPMGSDLDED